MSSIKPLFSTHIGIFNIKNIDNLKLVDYAKKNTKINQVKEVKDIVVNPLFKDLNSIVWLKMKEYANEFCKKTCDIELVRAWTNIGNDKYIVEPHHHKASFISAVYYPSASASNSEIVFINPMTHLMVHQSVDMIDKWNEYNSEYYTHSIKTGDLVIFNSQIHHYVTNGNDDRISIAYDGIINE